MMYDHYTACERAGGGVLFAVVLVMLGLIAAAITAGGRREQ
jgi:hypothetical protein